MAAVKQPNRKCLDPSEIAELDAAMASYEQAKKDAYLAYTAMLVEARKERDDRIVGVIKAGRRSTKSRVVDYLPLTYTAVGDICRRWEARNASQAA